MALHTIDVTGSSPAPIEAVWALLADVATWSEWGAFDTSRLKREGSPDAEGVGALREFRRARVRNLERVVRFDPPNAFSYEVVGGNIPVRGYHADVTLSAIPDGGTQINWRSTFKAKWPGSGGLVERKLTEFVEETVRLLAQAAAAPRP
jgi:hypothetical protein